MDGKRELVGSDAMGSAAVGLDCPVARRDTALLLCGARSDAQVLADGSVL